MIRIHLWIKSYKEEHFRVEKYWHGKMFDKNIVGETPWNYPFK
jgi:hypothetical protein